MRTDRILVALRGLDPQKRALLELHFWRGVSDAEIGELLQIDPLDVRQRRRAGVEDLCAELGTEGSSQRRELIERLHSMPDQDWRADPAAGRLSTAQEAAARRRRSGAIITAISAVVLVAVIAWVLVGGGDDQERERDSGSLGNSVKPAPDTSGTSAGRQVRLRPLGGRNGAGTAQLRRDGTSPRLLIRVRGLPEPRRAGYVVWLYNGIGDARSIGGSQRGRFRLDAPLPKDASRFRAIDISLEPRDGIRAHGGESVLRAPLAELGNAR